MSDRTRRIEFVLAAKDEASRVVKETTARMRKELAQASRAAIPLASRSSDRVALAFPKPDRTKEEQQIRDMVAGRIRAMRDTAQRMRLQEEVNKILYGEDGPAKPRAARFSAMEQEIRDEMAARIRAMRSAAQSANVQEEVNRRLGTGPGPAPFNPTAAEGLAAFGRSNATSRTQQMARNMGAADNRDWYKKLKDQTDGLEKMGKIVKGIGALGIVSEVGRAMQRLPEIQNQYYENIRQGMTGTQAFATAVSDAVPIVGDLAKGFRGLWDWITTTEADVKKRQRKEDQQDARDTRQAQNERNQRRRGQLLAETDGSQRDAARRRAIALASGPEKERLAAQYAFDDQVAEADRLNAKAGSLSRTEEQDRVREAAKQKRLAAEVEYRQKLKEIDDRFSRQASAAEGEFSRNAARLAQETEDSRLERAGQGAEARRRQRKREFEEAESDLRAQMGKALEGISADDPRSTMVVNAFKRAMDANRSRFDEGEAAAAQAEARDLEDYRRGNRQSNLQGDAAIAARRARIQGKSRDAEEIENRSQLQAQLEEIDRRASEEKRQNAERSAEIDAQARKDAERALEESALSQVEQARNRARQFGQEGDSLFKGETRLLSGRGDSRGAADPGVKLAKTTGDAVAQALKEPLKKLDKLDDVVNAIATLAGKLGVVTAVPG